MRVSVVGVANAETVVPIGDFPVAYGPTRHLPGRISTRVGGVGFNVARAVAALGGQVALTAPLAQDAAGAAVRAEAATLGVELRTTAAAPARTPRSVVLVDDDGRRQIHTDLGGALGASVDEGALLVGGQPADVAVLGNLDLSRPLLRAARRIGVTTTVDLQDVEGWDNPYDHDFLAGADVLLASGERLLVPPDEFLAGLLERSRAGLVVLGLGSQGCVAWRRGASGPVRCPAVKLPPGTDTTGAGDALVAGVVCFSLDGDRPLQEAMALTSMFVGELLVRRAADLPPPDRASVRARVGREEAP